MIKIKSPLWFRKSEDLNPQSAGVQDASDMTNEDFQGGYTDHNGTPLHKRNMIAPMHGEEESAFDYVINKMEKAYPESTKLRDLIDHGLDDGWFFTGGQGELRVSREEPE